MTPSFSECHTVHAKLKMFTRLPYSFSSRRRTQQQGKKTRQVSYSEHVPIFMTHDSSQLVSRYKKNVLRVSLYKLIITNV